MSDLEYEFLSVFSGSAGQTLGLLSEEPRLMGKTGRFVCRAGIDNDPVACEDYERFTGAKAWCVDVMAIGAFWSRPMFWAAFGRKAPPMVVISAPCRGLSRLLTAAKSKTKAYRQLNRLAAVFLDAMLDAWGDDPPSLILFENVPGVATRGRAMLRTLKSLLRAAGYKFHQGNHDCGELGGLAQHRERFLLVARHPKKCEAFLYEPPKKRVRGVGEVLSALPMPATEAAKEWGELHTMPRLSWRNWKRLALIPAGGDWRDLEGVLKEREKREVFRRHAVQDWTKPTGAVTGSGGHSVGAISDPRIQPDGPWRPGTFGVKGWEDPSGTVTGGGNPSKGAFSVADPRAIAFDESSSRHWNKHDVRRWTDPALTVIGKEGPSNGGATVADPRIIPEGGWHNGAMGVRPWDEPAATVTSGDHPAKGRFAVADPRVDDILPKRDLYDAGYGVLDWKDPARTIAGTAAAGTGAYAVADPRDRGFVDGVRFLSLDEAMELDLDPDKPPPFIPVIVAEDGTWHRPLTLLELAALQSFPVRMPDGSPIFFGGTRTQIASHIGNAIPPDAARAVGRQALLALMAHSLEAGFLGVGQVWVGPQKRAREIYVS